MMCETCGHAHTRTEQAVRYTTPCSICHKVMRSHTHRVGIDVYQHNPSLVENIVESTMMICSAPGCYCTELSPVDYEDRIALIKAGELDGNG